MPNSLNDFKSSFSNDIARQNRFDVVIPIPLTLIPFRDTARTLTLRCEKAELPSRTFATTEQKFGAAPVEKYPYAPEYNELNLDFLVSGDMSEKIFFDAWLDYISPTYSYNFKYKSDYVTTMQINQYDLTNNLTYSVNIIDAYPISVNQLDLDWGSENFHKLTVVFAYTNWQNNSIQSLGTSLLQTTISQITAGFGGLGNDTGITVVDDTAVTKILSADPNSPYYVGAY
jgi:hypothetical protein